MANKKILKALAIAAITTSLVACSDSSSNDKYSTTATSSSSGSSISTTKTASPADKTNVIANASYTIGYGMGSSIAADKNIKVFQLNNDKIIIGFEDAISAKKPAIPLQSIANNVNMLRNKMQQQMNEKAVTSFLKLKDSIYDSDLTPKSDVKNPAVVVYEFFDYQCMYCSKLIPEIEKIMKDNSDVKVVFTEFPIFGQKAPASEYAAEVGTAIYKLYGSDAYIKYHNGIFATGEDEGSLKNLTVDKVAKQAGADMTKVKKTIQDDKIADHLKATLEMGFDQLGIQGTPFLVIAPAKDATVANTTIIGGYTAVADIQAAINKAKSATTVATTSSVNQTDTKQAQENIDTVVTEAQATSGSTNRLAQNQDDGSVKA
ncbi:thioredoxin domain-containing protein [Francisella persica]|uniref:thioredoxin domain-containing protein n=1 Tax=Francisella persica TaxID=954 RepID=UPI0011873E2F|nr:thioredoxin domain-containing protein [Francisella persica]